MLDIGFGLDRYTYYSIERLPDSIDSDDFITKIAFDISPDIELHTRAIYNIWDFLGDIGGLFDMLRLMASPIIAFSATIFGNGLHRYLIKSLFRIEKKPRRKNHNVDMMA